MARERDSPTGGIITAIAQIDDSDLGDAELVGLCTLLLFAGHETTTTLLGNAAAGTGSKGRSNPVEMLGCLRTTTSAGR